MSHARSETGQRWVIFYPRFVLFLILPWFLRSPRGTIPPQNLMTNRCTCGPGTWPCAAPTAAAPWPPSRPHRQQRLLLLLLFHLLLATKRYQALACRSLFASAEKWNNLETPVFSSTWKSRHSWLQPKPVKAHWRHFVDFQQIGTSSSK